MCSGSRLFSLSVTNAARSLDVSMIYPPYYLRLDDTALVKCIWEIYSQYVISNIINYFKFLIISIPILYRSFK